MSVKNFVQCGLVTPIAPNTVELVLVAPTASYQYPPLDGGTLVIADSVARPTFYEIISYTHRIDNVLYGVVRAKEGTTARAWTGTTWIYQALTAQDYVDALALKAPLASPALTGVPTAPTAPLGTNTQQIATMAAVQAAIANLVASSPAALDTLNELAAALGNDPNFATTINNALAGKEPTIAAGTSAQMWLGNKTWASVLTQVQNTLLTGLGAGSNATILTTDTLIGALAKIQNQLNNKANFTDSRLSDAREWTATEVSQAEAEAGTVTLPRKWSALRVWQAVLASSLTGLNLTVGTAVTATDTVLVAIGKLQKQITDAVSNLAGSVRATVLTGYVSGSNVALASTDTVLAAFGKLQAQITGLATSKLNSNANAVSATKLQTARTINGVSFDGTADITVADATKLSLAGGTVTGTITNNGARCAIVQNGEIGGMYVEWNAARMYTVQVNCSNNIEAYGGIRWTKWGERHLGAIDCYAGGTNSSAPQIDFHVGYTTNAFSFRQGGHLVAAGNVTAYSDIRLKKDIRVIPAALAKVEQLSGVTYERIDSGERQTGLIAQEVQKVLPEAVSGDDMLSVAYGNLVGLLVEAIKELKAEVEELKIQVDNQAREIAELRVL